MCKIYFVLYIWNINTFWYLPLCIFKSQYWSSQLNINPFMGVGINSRLTSDRLWVHVFCILSSVRRNCSRPNISLILQTSNCQFPVTWLPILTIITCNMGNWCCGYNYSQYLVDDFNYAYLYFLLIFWNLFNVYFQKSFPFKWQ